MKADPTTVLPERQTAEAAAWIREADTPGGPFNARLIRTNGRDLEVPAGPLAEP